MLFILPRKFGVTSKETVLGLPWVQGTNEMIPLVYASH